MDDPAPVPVPETGIFPVSPPAPINVWGAVGADAAMALVALIGFSVMLGVEDIGVAVKWAADDAASPACPPELAEPVLAIDVALA